MNVVKRSVVNHPYISLAIVIVLAAVLYAMIVFPQTQAEKYLAKIKPEDLQKPEVQKIAFDIENASRLTIAQILGGFALLAGLYFTYQNVNVAQRNLRVTEEGKITDRFSKAVEMLGSDKLDVRLGGIYALERIARDSQKDHWTVMEVLTAFVRENSDKKLEGQKDGTPREDIQAIMSVIGRRNWTETETKGLNLQKANLADCFLREANLENAVMTMANLDRANLYKANLSKSHLGVASLLKAELREANLSQTYLFKANLSGAKLQKVNFTETDLRYANLNNAKLYGAEFKGADVRGVSYKETLGLTLEQILSTTEFDYYSLPDDIKEQLKEKRRLEGIKIEAVLLGDSGETQD